MSEKKYYNMNFSVNQLNHCCGIGEIGGFHEQNSPGWWGAGRPQPLYATRLQQAKATYKEILERTWGGSDDSFSTLILTLVSCYGAVESENQLHKDEMKGTHQWQEMQDVLLKEGWQINQVFINPNHGNEVTMFSKHFADRDTDPYADDNDWDD